MKCNSLVGVVEKGRLGRANAHVSILEAKPLLGVASPVKLDLCFAQVTAECIGSHRFFTRGGPGVTWIIADGYNWIFGVCVSLQLQGRESRIQMKSVVIGVATIDVTSDGDGGNGMSPADVMKIVTYWTLVEPNIILDLAEAIIG
ncbi:hypothetical protein FA15DRAFT_519303 [Coprinopsis marcescibilis]|uniref:Uncharacterized protein n=1 Tax=Coprinopsis marcescibilis TaxID=230819 RepID=A0A5C3KPE5_COPMA|nr:hypothetical protein FA15DRAFT_519303 [Coprinopsis marcescibilis]